MGWSEGISGLGCLRKIPLIHNIKLWSKNKHVFISAAFEIQKKKKRYRLSIFEIQRSGQRFK